MFANADDRLKAKETSRFQALVHVDPSQPGFSRRALKRGFAYLDCDGKRIRDPAIVARLDAIALPPAYDDAWYAPDPNAHILATGTDAAGRRQYRYHPSFSAHRDARKFASCAAFGLALPAIRSQVERELRGRKLTQSRAVASIIRLLDTGRVRVGNDCYAQKNGSFGATTLRRRHVRLKQDALHLRFKAKSGKTCEMTVSDRGLLRFVKQVLDLPGQTLFQFEGEDGEYHAMTSSHVNDYIHAIAGAQFTAKDFRTWRANVLAFAWLREDHGSPRTLKAMLAHVSAHLCNTPAVARKAYIHPRLVEQARTDPLGLLGCPLPRRAKWLSREERGLIAYLSAE
jgi:DNA topoisomerase-1